MNMQNNVQQDRVTILRRRFFGDLGKSHDFQRKVKNLRSTYGIDIHEQYLGNPKSSDLLICHPDELEDLQDPIKIQLNKDFYAEIEELCRYFNLPEHNIDLLRKYVLLGRWGLPPKYTISFRRGVFEVVGDFDISEAAWRNIWKEIQSFKKQLAKSNKHFNFGVTPKLTAKGSDSMDTILWFWRKQKNPAVKVPSTFTSIINKAGNSVKQKWRDKIHEWEEGLESPIDSKN